MTDTPVPPTAPRIAIITGLSGAGRSTAANVLEDLGYFVIDNLPPSLIEPVVELASAQSSAVDKVALVVDVRGRAFSTGAEGADDELEAALDHLGERDVEVRVLFLEASDEALVQRFEAVRRVHPLARENRVIDGIAQERRLLSHLRMRADLVVDTTDLNVHSLRERLVDAFAESDRTGPAVNVVTFGFKNGTPRDLDMQFDVRFLPNPHWIDELRPLTGLDEPVRDFVMGQDETAAFIERLQSLFAFLVPAFEREGKHYLTIGIGCTGGKHRSVVLGEALGEYLRSLGVGVQVDHRDRGRE